MLQTLPIDAAIVLFTVGMLLIFVEINRPGWLVPGAAGLTAVLFAVYAVAVHHPSLVAILLLITALGLLFLTLLPIFGSGLSWRAQSPYAIGAATPLTLGFNFLDRGAKHPLLHASTSVVCALLLCLITIALTQIARRARRNKGMA